LWIRTRTLADIGQALRLLGERLGSTTEAEAAAERFKADLAERPLAARDDLRPAFYQVSDRPLYTLGRRHIINEVLGRCGLNNIFANLDTEAAAVDFEAVLARQPQVVIISEEPGNASPMTRWERAQSQLPDSAQLIKVDPTTLIRPTPRIIEGIDQLCAEL